MDRGHFPQISDLGLFADCTKAELRQISSLTTLLPCGKGEILIREGRPAREFIIIGSGQARLTRFTNEGISEVTDVGAGEPLDALALLAGLPWTVTATALTDLTIFVSSLAEFESVLRVAPSVGQKLWQTVEHEVPAYLLTEVAA